MNTIIEYINNIRNTIVEIDEKYNIEDSYINSIISNLNELEEQLQRE